MGYIDCAEYRASVERHFENLKRPVETAVKIAVEINPLITVYLYGSMARKIRKIMRAGVKIFQLDSDGDIMIELSKSAAATSEESYRFRQALQWEYKNVANSVLGSDWGMIDTFPDPLGVKIMWQYNVVANEENIPLYRVRQFIYPKNW